MARKKKRTIPRWTRRSGTARWKKLLVAALAAGTIGGGALAAGNLPYFKGEKVIEVVDGDTFIIENKQPIRLYGINAPDIHYCFGKEAQQALSSLILGKRVQLREPEVDRFGRRVMSLVYVNGVLVNEVMIRAGFAEYENEGGSQGARMDEANTYARENHIGIYSPECYRPEPPHPSCTIKGNFDKTKYKKIYFTPQCGGYPQVFILKYQGDDWFCTEAEAKRAGFVQSETCK
jgi:endonuclease YncB( thermonuclease family)